MIIAKFSWGFNWHSRSSEPLNSAQLNSRLAVSAISSFWQAFLVQSEAPSSRGKPSAPIMVYVSFSTSDLCNWKYQKHPFFEIPRHHLSRLFSIHTISLGTTANSYWIPCLHWRTRPHKIGSLESGLGTRWKMLDDNDFPIESLFSSSWPSRDPNTNKVKGALGTYQQTFLAELQALAQKPTHRPRSTTEWVHSVKHCCCDPVAPEIRKNYRD